MLRPIAIASDGLLDSRYLPGIATRGYLWNPEGLAAGALVSAVLPQTPTVIPGEVFLSVGPLASLVQAQSPTLTRAEAILAAGALVSQVLAQNPTLTIGEAILAVGPLVSAVEQPPLYVFIDGYLFVGALPVAVEPQAPTLVEIEQDFGEIHTSWGWAEEPAVFTRFLEDRHVDASLYQPVATARQEGVQVSAIWVDGAFVLAGFEDDKRVSARVVEVGFVFLEPD